MREAHVASRMCVSVGQLMCPVPKAVSRCSPCGLRPADTHPALDLHGRAFSFYAQLVTVASMNAIVQDGDPVLRAIAEPVPEELFGTDALNDMLHAMEVALDAEPDGVALAAPQIGISYRIFIARLDRTVHPEESKDLAPELAVFINPEFVRSSQRRIEMDEGCLSVRGFYGKTKRHDRATVRARSADGSTFERGGGGIVAQIYQHEIDHLNGILFIDHATDIVETSRPDESQETL